MAILRPKIVFCQGGTSSKGDLLVRRLEDDGCVVECASSVRQVLEAVRECPPSAIVCDALLEDGTATMLFDLIEKDFPRPVPPIFVLADLSQEISLAGRRMFSGVIIDANEEAISRISGYIRA